jgi:thymidine phosphorylase
VAIIGQTGDLAPADRRLYGVRDVTGTVDCLPLIVASILGKKLAEGLDGLVLDVKFGSGAVMADFDQARDLAIALCQTARSAGTPTKAILSDMNQALARNAGNALEILEIVELLNGQRQGGRLFELSRELSADLLVVGGLASLRDEALAQLDKAWQSGSVAERFARMVSALGGPTDLLEKPAHHLPAAPVRHDLLPDSSGRVKQIDVRALGLAVIKLGGGRRQASDAIDMAVGLEHIAGLNEPVDERTPLLTIHANSEGDIRRITPVLREAFILAENADNSPSLIRERIED